MLDAVAEPQGGQPREHGLKLPVVEDFLAVVEFEDPECLQREGVDCDLVEAFWRMVAVVVAGIFRNEPELLDAARSLCSSRSRCTFRGAG